MFLVLGTHHRGTAPSARDDPVRLRLLADYIEVHNQRLPQGDLFERFRNVHHLV
jgi:hypothetical protein